MRRFAAILSATLALGAPSNNVAAAQVSSCHIGKPSYCFKYGGTLCEKWNKGPAVATACQAWTGACLDCHATIPDCLGHKRPASASPVCTRCNARWLACMKRIDAKFWPNRMQPRE